MIDPLELKQQLKRIDGEPKFFGRPEIRELPNILFDNEQIAAIIYGRYSGGFATLCATNRRVLLIDKKPFYLTLEDIRYDMVSDVMFNHRLLDATLLLGTVHKSIAFTAFNPHKLRSMTNLIQMKVMEFRQHHQVDDGQFDPTEQVLNSYQSAEEQAANMPRIPINPYKTPIVIRRRVSRFY